MRGEQLALAAAQGGGGLRRVISAGERALHDDQLAALAASGRASVRAK